jgi:hypothetical protein
MRAILLASAVVLFAACGGENDSVSVDEYASDLCTALIAWTETVRTSQTELQESAQPGQSPEDDRQALQDFVDEAVDASDRLVEDLEAAGMPDTENGEEAANAFRTAAADTRSELEDAQDEVAELPTDSAQAYRSAVDEFVAELSATLDGIDDQLQDVDAPELEQALDEASACQG